MEFSLKDLGYSVRIGAEEGAGSRGAVWDGQEEKNRQLGGCDRGSDQRG